jgi:hypothetical protein
MFGRSLLFCLLLASAAFAQRDALDSALVSIGLTRSTFRVDPEVMLTRTGQRFKLPVFDQWFEHPLRIPFFERHLRNSLLESQGRAYPLFSVTSATVSLGTRRELISPTPLQKYLAKAEKPDGLKTAIRELDSTAIIDGIERVPLAVQKGAAVMLFAASDARKWRRMALRDLPRERLPELFARLTEPVERPPRDSTRFPEPPFPENMLRYYGVTDLLAKVDFLALMSGADDLTAALDTVCAMLTTVPEGPAFTFTCRSRWGEIRISSGTTDTYWATNEYLLIMDLSGDDTYYGGGATCSLERSTGILIDVSGDDHYESSGDRPSFGTGVLGYGLLADLAGNDIYTTKGFYSQGAGVAGAGMLLDFAGNDSYDAMGGAQGFGNFGIGVLSDRDGNDLYSAYVYSQGCGMTQGFGLLLDHKGDDVYTANDSDIIYPSPQTAQHNGSMCQGAGYGVRRDYIDGHSLAGGVGMLLDATGNDTYFGGVFSQAVGYWYAIGILDDRAGNDTYRDVWYGQSATAHMGVSYLAEGGGDDTYTSLMTMSTAAAHDFSASVFVDEAGNDSYSQTANCLGRALNNGVALFVDMAGIDRYAGKDGFGSSTSFFSTGLRSEVPEAAIFLDLTGNDVYPDSTMGNNRRWLQATSAPLPVLRGVGLDGDSLRIRWD